MNPRDLSYDSVGITRPEAGEWASGAGRLESSATVGQGVECWERARVQVFEWAVKTESGFTVEARDGGEQRARLGGDYELTARMGPLTIHEPIRVVAVVDEDSRCGFAYGTRPGHPVRGEEAFLLHRDAEDRVRLTIRSFTRPASGKWFVAFPLLLVAQRLYRRRYLRSLQHLCA
jgi:uncharacterized protein (UPF0548 family)